MFKERGEILLLKFADRLKDVGALEGMPKMEGKRMLVMFAPQRSLIFSTIKCNDCTEVIFTSVFYFN